MEDNRALRLLISILTVSATFALGRLIARRVSQRDDNPQLQVPLTDQILIMREPAEVYRQAKQLSYFDRFLFGVNEVSLVNPSTVQLVLAEDGAEYRFNLEVIADQPGEFFGLRLEHKGELYGTFGLRFDRTPGRQPATLVSVYTRYKHDFSTSAMNWIKAVVAREVAAYLAHLEEVCMLDDVAQDGPIISAR